MAVQLTRILVYTIRCLHGTFQTFVVIWLALLWFRPEMLAKDIDGTPDLTLKVAYSVAFISLLISNYVHDKPKFKKKENGRKTDYWPALNLGFTDDYKKLDWVLVTAALVSLVVINLLGELSGLILFNIFCLVGLQMAWVLSRRFLSNLLRKSRRNLSSKVGVTSKEGSK